MENVLVNEQYLKDVAEAIRAKNETDNTYTPGEMAAAISELKTDFVTEPLEVTENGIYTPGDGVDGFNKVTVETAGVTLPEEAYVITGDCQYRFATGGWDWFIECCGDKITTKDITDARYMFICTETTKIPFDINITNCQYLQGMFSNAHNLTTCPKIRGTIKWNTSTSFYENTGLMRVRYMDDLFTPEMLDGFSTVKVTSAYTTPKGWSFFNGHSLRRIPQWWYKFKLNPESTAFPSSSYVIYNNCFGSTYALDEVLNIPVWDCQGAQTSNMFSYTFENAYRLKNITFETNEDGTPKTAKWKSQTIDLTKNVGYCVGPASITTEYNSGITADKEVTDDATYQALKNDPDWFTKYGAYSRYNHDSAVATINSLPDTSAYLATAGGTNTIKFEKQASIRIEQSVVITGIGEYTDGGAITALTAEEIAVAAAKGWTVTFAD